MASWNEKSAADYRRLEREQRDLAADASSTSTRDIHLEFAERYRKLAEGLEIPTSPAADKPIAR